MERSETADGDRATDRDLDRRLQTIERRFDKVDGKLDRLIDVLNGFRLEAATRFGSIESRLTRIETAMEAKASVSEVSDLRGSVKLLPTVWQLITLVFGILAGAFAIARFGLPHP